MFLKSFFPFLAGSLLPAAEDPAPPAPLPSPDRSARQRLSGLGCFPGPSQLPLPSSCDVLFVLVRIHRVREGLW